MLLLSNGHFPKSLVLSLKQLNVKWHMLDLATPSVNGKFQSEAVPFFSPLVSISILKWQGDGIDDSKCVHDELPRQHGSFIVQIHIPNCCHLIALYQACVL